jgi:hypothetical protein
MYQDDYILDKVGAEGLSIEKKASILEQVRTHIGEAISEQLTEQQLNEYQAIIDDNDVVIHLWLEQNVPDYKNTYAFQQLAEAYHTDPERNRPEKLFATVAWVEVNVPNVKEITDRVIDTFKIQ